MVWERRVDLSAFLPYVHIELRQAPHCQPVAVLDLGPVSALLGGIPAVSSVTSLSEYQVSTDPERHEVA
jgi:hypothetical protein